MIQPQLVQAAVSFVAAGAGDNTVVAGVAGKFIEVFGLFLASSAAVNVTLKNGTGGTALTGAIPVAVAPANYLSFLTSLNSDVAPLFTATGGNNFVVNVSGAATVTGTIWYTQI